MKDQAFIDADIHGITIDTVKELTDVQLRVLHINRHIELFAWEKQLTKHMTMYDSHDYDWCLKQVDILNQELKRRGL